MSPCSVLLFSIFLQFGSVVIEAHPRRLEMDASCHGKNYCMTKPQGYPQKRFEKIMHDLNVRAVEEEQIGQRNGPGSNEIDKICEKKQYFRPIYQIVDKEGDVRYVAQIPNKFIQKHQIVECVKPGRVTYGGDVFTPNQLQDFNVTCVETRLDHKFLVLSHDGEKVEITSALNGIPVWCSCRYSFLE